MSGSHPLMLPPPGYKFIPNSDKVCGKPGCFECFSIYCVRCESKDRRIVELELRNNELVKHITLLQGQLFPRGLPPGASGSVSASGLPGRKAATAGSAGGAGDAVIPGVSGGTAMAVVQSPVLYDPNLNVNYSATTTFHRVP